MLNPFVFIMDTKKEAVPPKNGDHQFFVNMFMSSTESVSFPQRALSPRLQLVLANGPLGEHLSLGRATVEPPEGRQSPPTEEEEEPDAEVSPYHNRICSERNKFR